MAHSSRVERRKERRQESGVQLRKDRFISEYIQRKYNKLHTEAEGFYNTLRILYPNKYDLRKTAEYFAWKNQLSNIKTIETHPQPISTSRELAYIDKLQLEIPLFTRKSKTTTVAAAETHESAIVEPQEQETDIVEPQEQETANVEPQEQETANVGPQEQETANVEPQEQETANVGQRLYIRSCVYIYMFFSTQIYCLLNNVLLSFLALSKHSRVQCLLYDSLILAVFHRVANGGIL